MKSEGVQPPGGSGGGLRVAVVGATGVAGSTLLAVLADRGFPVAEVVPLASRRSAGQQVRFRDATLTVAELDASRLAGVDVAFFAAGAEVSRRFAPLVAAGGGLAVDKSSAFRQDPNVPLVVPEVNGHLLASHPSIVATPNCVAIPLTVALAPLHRAFGLRRLVVSTYQSASGGGRALVEELRSQERADVEGRVPSHSVYPHVLHGNVVPGGWTMHGAETDEERKVVAETRRVLDLPDLPVAVTTVRVPVVVGHGAAVWAEFTEPVDPDVARELLASAPGVRVVDDPQRQLYPTPRAAAGQDDVLVGRIRSDGAHPGGLAFFLCADNLRKGAATNAVQIAERVLGAEPVGAPAR